MKEKFEAIRERVNELRQDETLSILDLEFKVAKEFKISHEEAVANITLCALADSLGARQV